ncbi:MAG: hypothetical protein M3N31_06350 [Actinomycetota bacterium]|nr:hypothetical protein [Actinomycetota bacterium]
MSSEGLHIELARSGGFAGITVRSSLDTGDLPPDEAARIEALFEQADLAALPGPGPRPGAVDRFQYDLIVTRGEERRHVSVGEKDVTPALRQLIDEVMARRSGPAPGRG